MRKQCVTNAMLLLRKREGMKHYGGKERRTATSKIKGGIGSLEGAINRIASAFVFVVLCFAASLIRCLARCLVSVSSIELLVVAR